MAKVALEGLAGRADAERREPTALNAYRPAPICPRCGNRGFVRRDVEVRHPSFGNIVPCPEAGCPGRRGLTRFDEAAAAKWHVEQEHADYLARHGGVLPPPTGPLAARLGRIVGRLNAPVAVRDVLRHARDGEGA